jgi:cyclopropane fatty-acyl-phospholipid synthase-like methyltransferase
VAQWLEIAVLAVVCLAALSIVWGTLRFGISPMPSSARVRDALVELLDPALEGTVHELGAGWGTLAFAIARRCPKVTVVAHEASPVPFAFCVLRKALGGVANVELRFGDFLGADLRGARGVVTYLWTGGMQQLSTKFDAELSPGSFVLSHTFAWRGREPSETRVVDDLFRTHVYRYVIAPAPR